MRKIVITVLTTILSINLFAGAVAGGSTEFTQIAKYITDNSAWSADYSKQVNQLATQSRQLQQNIQATQMMTQNLQNLQNFDWQNFATNLARLQNAMRTTNALSYSMANYDKMFRNHFKGYSDYYDIANNNSLTPGEKSASFSDQYKAMDETSRNTIKGTLDSLHLQQSDFANEDATINTLRNNSHNAVGNKAVIQAANDIALFQVDQTRKLRATVMNQINLQSEYMAKQNAKQSIEEAKDQWRKTAGNAPIIGDEKQNWSWSDF